MSKQRLSRAQSQEQTRQLIIESATALFLREGFMNTSVGQVAEAAGYTVGAIYSNFGGKVDIGIAVVDALYSRTAERILQTQASTAGQGIQASLDALWAAIEPELGNQQWARVEMEVAVLGSQDGQYQTAVAARYQRVRALGQVLVTQWYLGAGLAIPPDLESRVTALMALVLGLGIQRAMDPAIPLPAFRQTLEGACKAIILGNTAAAS